MHLSFLAPLWFELIVIAVLVGRAGLDRALAASGRDLLARRRHPVEFVILISAGLVLVALLRSGHPAAAAGVLVLLVLADLAWEYIHAPLGRRVGA